MQVMVRKQLQALLVRAVSQEQMAGSPVMLADCLVSLACVPLWAIGRDVVETLLLILSIAWPIKTR